MMNSAAGCHAVIAAPCLWELVVCLMGKWQPSSGGSQQRLQVAMPFPHQRTPKRPPRPPTSDPMPTHLVERAHSGKAQHWLAAAEEELEHSDSRLQLARRHVTQGADGTARGVQAGKGVGEQGACGGDGASCMLAGCSSRAAPAPCYPHTACC